MFTLEKVNYEVDKYNRYTSFNVPYIQNIIYGHFPHCQAEVNVKDLSKNEYIIYIDNSMNDFNQEYQNGVIWHELTHIADYLKYQSQYKNCISSVLKSYSEAHAENIKLRYLLHIQINTIIGKERRSLFGENGKTTLDLVSATYGNQSIYNLKAFIETKDPYEWDTGITNFFYFCGFFNLHNSNYGEKLCDYIISMHPEQYRNDLKSIYSSIVSGDIQSCILKYNQMNLDAVKYSIS